MPWVHSGWVDASSREGGPRIIRDYSSTGQRRPQGKASGKLTPLRSEPGSRPGVQLPTLLLCLSSAQLPAALLGCLLGTEIQPAAAFFLQAQGCHWLHGPCPTQERELKATHKAIFL